MGSFNFPKHSLTWSRCEGNDSDLVPLVPNHRESEAANGKQDRLQATKLCGFAVKHCLIQQVDMVTHGAEVLDLIFTNNPDLVSSVSAESWPKFKSSHSPSLLPA